MKILLFTALLALFFAGQAQSQGKSLRWRMATLAPDGIGWATLIKKNILPYVEETTDGNLTIKVFWGGVLGDEEDYIAKIKQGKLEGAGLSAQGAALACPQMALLSLPFLFEGYDEVDYVRERTWDLFGKLFEEKGFFLLSWNDQDFDQVYSSRLPLNTLEGFYKSRFISWAGPVEEAVLGAIPADFIMADVPEVPRILRSGEATAAIGPAIWVVGSQMHATVRYVNQMNIRYSPSLIAVSLEAWRNLPEKFKQNMLSTRMKVNENFCLGVRRQNQKHLEAMIQYGVRKSELDARSLALLAKKTRVVWDRLADRLYSRELLNQVLSILDDFRKQKNK